jgi:hypothetical protein
VVDAVWIRRGSGIVVRNVRLLPAEVGDHYAVAADLLVPLPVCSGVRRRLVRTDPGHPGYSGLTMLTVYVQ